MRRGGLDLADIQSREQIRAVRALVIATLLRIFRCRFDTAFYVRFRDGLNVALSSRQLVGMEPVAEILGHCLPIGEKPTLHELHHQKHLILRGCVQTPTIPLIQMLPGRLSGWNYSFRINQKNRFRGKPPPVQLKRLLRCIAAAIAFGTW